MFLVSFSWQAFYREQKNILDINLLVIVYHVPLSIKFVNIVVVSLSLMEHPLVFSLGPSDKFIVQRRFYFRIVGFVPTLFCRHMWLAHKFIS
jgi:hypothetical protein